MNGFPVLVKINIVLLHDVLNELSKELGTSPKSTSDGPESTAAPVSLVGAALFSPTLDHREDRCFHRKTAQDDLKKKAHALAALGLWHMNQMQTMASLCISLE